MDTYIDKQKNTTSGEIYRTVRWVYIASPIILMMIACQMGKGSFGFFVDNDVFMKTFNFTYKDIGLISSIYLLAFGIGILFWGQFVDRIGAKRMCVFGIIAWSCFLLIGALAQSPLWIYVSRIGFGFTAALAWPIPNMFTSRWFPQNERHTINTLWVLGVPIGIAIVGLTLPFIMVASNWRVAYLFITAVSMLVALPLILFLTTSTPQTHRKMKGAELDLIRSGLHVTVPQGAGLTSTGRKAVLSNYRFWLITFAFVLDSIQVWGMQVWAPSYIHQYYSSMFTGGILTVGYLLSVPVGIVAGIWADRILQRAPFMVAGYLLVAVAFLLITKMTDGGAFGVALFVAAIVFNLGVATPANITALHSIILPDQMGFAASITTGVGNILASFSPFVIGVLIGSHNNYSGAFLFLSVVTFVAVLLSALLIPSRV